MRMLPCASKDATVVEAVRYLVAETAPIAP